MQKRLQVPGNEANNTHVQVLVLPFSNWFQTGIHARVNRTTGTMSVGHTL